MKRGRFSEEQIVGILKEHEAGRRLLLLPYIVIGRHCREKEGRDTNRPQKRAWMEEWPGHAVQGG